MKLILPFPPSVNTYWRHPNKGAFAGKSLISTAGRKFQSAACAAIVEQLRRLPKPTSAPASVEIVLFPPDNRPTFFAFAKGAGVMGEAGPEAILPLRRGADGKLGVVADIGGSGMAMFAPQYNIEINNDGTNGQIGPAALKVVYDLGKKAAADFMQQQARDGGRLSGAYR